MTNTESILATATEEQIIEARDWASDCIGLSAGVKAGAERAVRYVEMNYPGGWNGFLAEVFPPAPQAPANYGTIWVCQDCMLHHANGECGSCHDDDHGHDEEPLSSIGDGFHAAMGMAHEEHSCGRENGEDVLECDCETNTYSTSRCEGCGSYLHGERHAMTLFGPELQPWERELLAHAANENT